MSTNGVETNTSNKLRIMFFGPQGSGKSTVGENVAQKLGLPFVSMGRMLRAVPVSDPSYERLHDYMSRGELVPLEIAGELLKAKLDSEECANGYVLDGWGRNLPNLHFYDPNPTTVFVLHISDETIFKRISGRRVCTTDKEEYNIYTLPAEELAKCTGELIQREDDKPEAIAERLNIYKTETLAVIEEFKKRGIVHIVDAEPQPNIIATNILTILNQDGAQFTA